MISAVFLLGGSLIMMAALAVATIARWTDNLPPFVHGILVAVSMFSTILAALLVGLGL